MSETVGEEVGNRRAAHEQGAAGVVARLWAAFTAGPAYPPAPADLRTVRIVGVELPVRATVALFSDPEGHVVGLM